MGLFYPEIKIDRGLTVALKKARARHRKRGHRRREDPTTITVRDMQIGSVAGGSFSVRSSNLTPVVPLSAGWSADARKRLETRRRDGDGELKGRLLYGVLTTLNQEPMTIAALTYHFEKAGEVVIRNLEATADLTDHRPKIFLALTLAAERIAIETSKGKSGRLTFEVSRDNARWFKEKLGFRESGPAKQKSRVILCRDANVAGLRKAQRVAP